MVGIAVTLVLLVILGALFLVLLFPRLANAIGIGFSNGQEMATVWAPYLYLFFFALWALLVSLAAFFLGGLLVGRITPLHPESSAVAGAVILCVIALGLILWMWVPGLLIKDTLARSDNIDTFVIWAVAFCIGSPLAVLVSYLGGRMGGRHNRHAPRERPSQQ